MPTENTRSVVKGFALGLGLSWVARNLLPFLSPLIRPAIKRFLKIIFMGAERSREKSAILAEDLEDLVAEVRWELESESAKSSPAADEAPGDR